MILPGQFEYRWIQNKLHMRTRRVSRRMIAPETTDHFSSRITCTHYFGALVMVANDRPTIANVNITSIPYSTKN